MRYRGAVYVALAAAMAQAARGQSPAPVSPPPPPAGTAGVFCCLIPAGTPLLIELTEAVSSRSAKEGGRFPFRLVNDLTVGGVTVVAAGAPGSGEVLDAAASGLGGRPGKLVLAARTLDAGVNRIPLRSFRVAGMGTDQSATVLALSAVPYAGILAMGIKGGNVEYAAGSRAVAKVAVDTFIPVPGASPQPPAPPAPPPPTPPTETRP